MLARCRRACYNQLGCCRDCRHACDVHVRERLWMPASGQDLGEVHVAVHVSRPAPMTTRETCVGRALGGHGRRASLSVAWHEIESVQPRGRCVSVSVGLHALGRRRASPTFWPTTFSLHRAGDACLKAPSATHSPRPSGSFCVAKSRLLAWRVSATSRR